MLSSKALMNQVSCHTCKQNHDEHCRQLLMYLPPLKVSASRQECCLLAFQGCYSGKGDVHLRSPVEHRANRSNI